MTTIAAVLFDMDGTLVDSDAAVARAWAHWSRLRGVDPAEIARVTPGRPATDTIPELAPWLSPAEQLADARELLRRERLDLAGVVPTRGALELLAALDGWGTPWAVVTSADDALARARLGAAGVGLPKVLVTASTVRRGKPDPEGYRAAAAELGVEPARCLVVEDAEAGVRAGLAAGATVVSVRGHATAHLAVRDVAELRDRLTLVGDGTLSLDVVPVAPGF